MKKILKVLLLSLLLLSCKKEDPEQFVLDMQDKNDPSLDQQNNDFIIEDDGGVYFFKKEKK